MNTFSADSVNVMDLVPQWFEMLKQLRNDAISYNQLHNEEKIRNPVHRVCKLLNVKQISDIVDDHILYQAVVRVAQMDSEEPQGMMAILDGLAMDLRLEPSPLAGTSRCDTLTEKTMFRGTASAQSLRPKSLSAMLNLAVDSELQQNKKYSKFLHSADLAMQEIANACIGITPSYMCTAPESKKKSIHNPSLLEVFLSYSKLAKSTNKQSVYNFDDGKERIHIHELLQFGEDFGIYPRLMSKSDLKAIWSAVSLRHIKIGHGHLTGLNLNDFKDILVRIALFAYHKPTVKDLILRLNSGIMPSHIELVEYLCRYLHFDDQSWVKTQIQEKRAQFMKPEICTFGIVHNEYDFKASKAAKTAGKTAKTMGSSIGNTARLSKSMRNTISDGANPELLPFLKDKLGTMKDLKGISAYPRPLPGGMEDLFSSTRITPDYMDSEKSEETPEDNRPPAKQPEAIQYGDMTDEQRGFLSENLSMANWICFRKYSYDSRDQAESEWSYPGGNFIDMGCLKAGSECVIRLNIKNRTGDEIYLDTTCRGFDSSDLRVVTEPSALIPGLTRSLRILFTVDPGTRAVVGYIEVFVACVRTNESYSITCPVHYRVGPPSERDDWKCTTHNLTQLLAKDTEGRHKFNTLNFQSKKYEKFETIREMGTRKSTNQEEAFHKTFDDKAFDPQSFNDTDNTYGSTSNTFGSTYGST